MGVAFWASGQSGASLGSCPRCRHGRGDPAARAPCGHISLATPCCCPREPRRGHRASHPGDNNGQRGGGVPGHGAIWGGGCSFHNPPPFWMLDPGDPEFNPTYGGGTRCPRRRWLVTAEMSPPAGSGEALAVARSGGDGREGGPRHPPCHCALAPSPPRSGARVPEGRGGTCRSAAAVMALGTWQPGPCLCRALCCPQSCHLRPRLPSMVGDWGGGHGGFRHGDWGH